MLKDYLKLARTICEKVQDPQAECLARAQAKFGSSPRFISPLCCLIPLQSHKVVSEGRLCSPGHYQVLCVGPSHSVLTTWTYPPALPMRTAVETYILAYSSVRVPGLCVGRAVVVLGAVVLGGWRVFMSKVQGSRSHGNAHPPRTPTRF